MTHPQTDFEALLQQADEIRYCLAANRAQREAAFRRVYLSYLRAGLMEPNRHQMRVTPYHLVPTTDVFIAVLGREVISTISLIRDGQLGLPLESVYRYEVDRRRAEGKLLAEVSCLADRRSNLRRFFPVFIELCRWMVQCARLRGVEELLVAVHPRHARFYERYMAFERVGDETSYPAVCDRPAVALSLDFARIDCHKPASYNRFFGSPIRPELLRPAVLSPQEQEHFRQRVVPCFGFIPLGATEDIQHSRYADSAILLG